VHVYIDAEHRSLASRRFCSQKSEDDRVYLSRAEVLAIFMSYHIQFDLMISTVMAYSTPLVSGLAQQRSTVS